MVSHLHLWSPSLDVDPAVSADMCIFFDIDITTIPCLIPGIYFSYSLSPVVVSISLPILSPPSHLHIHSLPIFFFGLSSLESIFSLVIYHLYTLPIHLPVLKLLISTYIHASPNNPPADVSVPYYPL